MEGFVQPIEFISNSGRQLGLIESYEMIFECLTQPKLHRPLADKRLDGSLKRRLYMLHLFLLFD